MRKLAIAGIGAFILISVCAASSSLAAYIGWAVGSSGALVRSTDGGNTWTSFFSNAGFQTGAGHFHPDLFAVAAADTQNIWIAGANGFIEHTSNGGTSWTIQTDPSTQTIQKIQFIDSQNGWAVGDNGTIIHTSDGGVHWTVQTSGTTNGLGNLTFINSQNGWAVGSNGTILHTANGGNTWGSQASNTSAALNSARFLDALNGWAVGTSSSVLHTSDGGTTWTPQAGPYGPTQSAYLSDAIFSDALHGLVLADAGAGSTTNGGATWTAISTPETSLWRASFPDAQNGWVSVFQDDNFIHTTDGGATWSVQTAYPLVNGPLNDIDFITVPEPSTLILGLVGSFPLLLRRRRAE